MAGFLGRDKGLESSQLGGGHAARSKSFPRDIHPGRGPRAKSSTLVPAAASSVVRYLEPPRPDAKSGSVLTHTPIRCSKHGAHGAAHRHRRSTGQPFSPRRFGQPFSALVDRVMKASQSPFAEPRRQWQSYPHFLRSVRELLALVEAELDYLTLAVGQVPNLVAQQRAKVEIAVAWRLEKGAPVPERPEG